MEQASAGLARLVEGELTRPAPVAAERLAAEIRRRHGDALAAVVFYGSCLRRQRDEGVFDFYALVDSYRGAYRSRTLAAINALLPPNVFYLELGEGERTLRAKYALLTLSDFERGAGPASLRTGIWARFCQPSLAVWVRDAAAREALVAACVRCVLTAVECALPLVGSRGEEKLDAEALWQAVFRETYAREMRTESPEEIRGIYDAAPERFDRAARLALAALAVPGARDAVAADGSIVLRGEDAELRRARRRWRWRRPLAKAAYAAALFKTAATFGDWLPYVLWKLERHTGTHIVPSERQRRHPLVWGWPLLFRVLRQRDLR